MRRHRPRPFRRTSIIAHRDDMWIVGLLACTGIAATGFVLFLSFTEPEAAPARAGSSLAGAAPTQLADHAAAERRP
jgi:hypothetical protein